MGRLACAENEYIAWQGELARARMIRTDSRSRLPNPAARPPSIALFAGRTAASGYRGHS